MLSSFFAAALAAPALGKELVVYPRQDVYVEKQRPTWSYRTAILQVGKSDASDDASEYRAFVAFDACERDHICS